VTRLFRVCASLAPARPALRKRVTVRVTRLFLLLLFLIFGHDGQTRHMVRVAFVLRLCVAGFRASGAEKTRHGLRDAFVRFVVVLNIFR
jgi:hypothetical protein